MKFMFKARPPVFVRWGRAGWSLGRSQSYSFRPSLMGDSSQCFDLKLARGHSWAIGQTQSTNGLIQWGAG